MSEEPKTPFTEDETERMVAHMNEDHADSVLAYARHFGNFPEAVEGRLLGVDAERMRIEARSAEERHEIAIPFDHAVTSAHDAHMTMVKMSKRAKRALGKA